LLNLQEIWINVYSSTAFRECLVFLLIFLFLLLYRFLRADRWRSILGRSLDYHRFHLSMLLGDRGNDEKTRELAQALLWAVNKQLKDDLARSRSRGGSVLWSSFIGEKTCVNTCGTVFYESARNYSSVNRVIVKLNDTLLSTFYRILLVESLLSPFALIFMDMRLIISLIARPSSGTGRLYREMLSELRENSYKK